MDTLARSNGHKKCNLLDGFLKILFNDFAPDSQSCGNFTFENQLCLFIECDKRATKVKGGRSEDTKERKMEDKIERQKKEIKNRRSRVIGLIEK